MKKAPAGSDCERGLTLCPLNDLFIKSTAVSWLDWGRRGGAGGEVKKDSHDLSLTRRNQKDHDSSCAHNTEREQMAL